MLNRLTSWQNAAPDGAILNQESYTYDAADNLLTKGSNSFSHNNASEIASQGYAYDNNGNLTDDG